MSISFAPKNRVKIGAVLVVSCCSSVYAGGVDDSMVSLGGFGTLGAVHSSEQQADFTTNFFKPNGAGYTRDWSLSVDSLIGAQVTVKIAPRLLAVLQVITQQNYDNTYRPHVEWADLKYQITPDLSVRVGRIVLPSFLISDSRNVGYANPWLRPPLEVYGLIPISSSDGADMSYRLRIGDVTQTLVGTYGYSTPSIPLHGAVEARHLWLIGDTIEYGATTLHIAYEEARLTVDYLGDLFDAYRQFGPPGNALADKYDLENKRVTFLGLGGMYDPGNWFIAAEWGTTDLNSVLGKNTGWYVSSGYRVKKFTPYLTYGIAKTNNLSDPGLSLSSLPPYLAGPAAGLNAGLNSVLSTKRVQSTISAGARWDFIKNADLKLQFDHTRIGAGSSGELINLQPAFALGARVNLISVTFDFVF
ncbi:MAG: hypothetical protein ABJC66_02490 [Gammaproteobacteria bacterium]